MKLHSTATQDQNRAIQLSVVCLVALVLPMQALAINMMLAGPVSTVLPMISQIDGANSSVQTITSVNAPACDQPDGSCPTPGLADLEPHAACVDHVDDYLESDIKQAASNSPLIQKFLDQPLTNGGDIKPACILSSMTGFEDNRSKKGQAFAGSNYEQCTNQRPRHAVKPCMSNNYSRLVVNSYELVSKCMASYVSSDERGMQTQSAEDVESERKLDMEAIFGLVNRESGFHVTAKSSTGSGGTGQLGDSIPDVNKSLDEVRHYLENSSAAPECAGLSKEFLSTPMSARISCERTSVKDGNPVKNLIYMFTYLHQNRKSIEDFLFESPKRASKFSSLSEVDKDKLSRALMVWAHNTGRGGIETPLREMLKHTSKVTNVDQFLSQLKYYVKSFPAKDNASAGRRKETSEYYPHIQEELAALNKHAGDGSCQN